MNKAIDIKDLSLIYQTKDKEVEAIKNISFSVENVEFIDRAGSKYTDDIDFYVEQGSTAQTTIKI